MVDYKFLWSLTSLEERNTFKSADDVLLNLGLHSFSIITLTVIAGLLAAGCMLASCWHTSNTYRSV